MLRSRSAALALPLLLVLGSVLGGGCAGDDGRPAPSSPGTTAMPDDLRATDDRAGMLACDALSASMRDGTLMEPGITDSIVTSARSADGPIADSARRLRAAHTSATALRGTDDEPDAVAAVSAAGSQMLNVCEESGLKTVG